MSVVSMKELLEAGVHFGHPTRKWNPKMKKYIFTARNDIYILNLEQTVGLIDEAYAFVKGVVESGKSVLFVGTKKQAKDAIIEEAQRCDMFYMGNRWLGGTLTNFKTIRSRVDRLAKLNTMEKTGEFDLLPKKEVVGLKQERDKLEANLGGVKEMRSLPGVLFVVDPKKEYIAVREAHNLNIPIVGLVDTNCDPDDVDYVIPGNDDAIRAVKLIAGAMADAVIEAREGAEGLARRKEAEGAKETSNEEISSMEEVKIDFSTLAEDDVKEEVAPKAKKVVEKPVKEEKVTEKKEEKVAEKPVKAKAEEKVAEKKEVKKAEPAKKEAKTEKPATKKATTAKKPATKKEAK